MPGINIYELLILIGMAVVLLGPERLPQYARTLAGWVRQLRGMAEDAKVKFKDETGTDFDTVDWQRYDPRQYDPRRIIREALAEDYQDFRDTARDFKKTVDPRELFKSTSAAGPSAVAAGVAGAASQANAETSGHDDEPSSTGHSQAQSPGSGSPAAANSLTGSQSTPTAAATGVGAFMNETGFSLQAAPFDVDAT